MEGSADEEKKMKKEHINESWCGEHEYECLTSSGGEKYGYKLKI